MRPLPRLLAITNDTIAQDDNFPIAASAIASAGPIAAILVRAPGVSAEDQRKLVLRVRALVRPPEAAVWAHADATLGAAAEAHGLALEATGTEPMEARRIYSFGPVGILVRSMTDAERAARLGADFLVAGPVFPSPSDPGDPGHGIPWLKAVVALGIPVFAAGGIGVAQIAPAREAGAWGVAATSALWGSPDPAKAADLFARELAS